MTKFGFLPELPFGLFGGPDALVEFALSFDHSVEHSGDLASRSHGRSQGPQLGFHTPEERPKARLAVMQRRCGLTEQLPGAIVYLAHSPPPSAPADVVVRA
jgi:hypothetical protein